MLRPEIGRLLRRFCALGVLSVGIAVFWGGTSGYAVAQECSTCDFNWWNCSNLCNPQDPENWHCLQECNDALKGCSPGCTPSGMPYRPSCPSASACAQYGDNCETNCTADRDVCMAQCASGDTSCENLCQDTLNHCRAFCQADYYDCLWCSP